MTEQSPIGQEIKAIQSNLLVLSQKIKYLIHNEKILGRNILILNKKISSQAMEDNSGSKINVEEINKIYEKLSELENKIKSMESIVERISNKFAKKEDLKEIKYIIDNINPLEYTTVEQVKKLIEESKNK